MSELKRHPDESSILGLDEDGWHKQNIIYENYDVSPNFGCVLGIPHKDKIVLKE